MTKELVHTDRIPHRGKLVTAGIIFIGGFLSPVLIPVVTSSNLSTAWKVTLSGLLALGIPELFMVIAAAVAGKEGFSSIKNKIFGFLKKHGPPDTVSRTRYRIGLILFLIPIVVGWILPYISHHIPFYEENKFAINITGDIIFIVSLFMLGGDFWEKLRALFIYSAKAFIPDTNNKEKFR